MPHLLIKVQYKPDLKYYPKGVANAVEAMLFDARHAESGEGDIELLLQNDVEILGVVDEEGELHRLDSL